jgi:hypothetical protein
MTKPAHTCIAQVVLGLGWSYAGLLSAWLLLRLLLFDRLWWLALANTLAFYLFLPLLVAAPLALAWRTRRLLLALGLPCIVFVALFGELLAPPVARPLRAATGPAFTAMTFNLLKRNMDHDAIVRAIHAGAPDIIGLQMAAGYTLIAAGTDTVLLGQAARPPGAAQDVSASNAHTSHASNISRWKSCSIRRTFQVSSSCLRFSRVLSPLT